MSKVVTPSSNLDVADVLHRFYLAANFDERRGRFGGGVSDQALAAYCNKLDSSGMFVVCDVDQTTGRVCSVLEVHALDRGFRRAETVLCCFGPNRGAIIASLLRAAVPEASRRGCKTLVTDVANDRLLLASLRSLGASSFCDDVVSTDVSGHPLYRMGH